MTLSAACQTTVPIGHIVMLGGPIMGSPATSKGMLLQLLLRNTIPIMAHELTTTYVEHS